MNVLLNEILAAREARAARQRELLAKYRCPVVSFTMNIAGPVKTSPLIRRSFDAGLADLETAFQGHILSRKILHAVTGDEALFALDMDAPAIKSRCTAIEEATPMGRLFDMDVLDVRGQKLERHTERCCLVCGAPGRGCASRRVHTAAELQKATRKLITDHFDRSDADHIAAAAVKALLDEVRTTPKPGLVDLRNNGSHLDMDVPLFTASAHSLLPYFTRCAAIGQETADLPPEEAFPHLRNAGIDAERTMFAVTGGINTHKGAIYTMGVLCAAFGRLRRDGILSPNASEVLPLCAAIAGSAALHDLAQADPDTAGLRLYRSNGIAGIRGEMAAGLPSVRYTALPAFRSARSRGLSPSEAGAVTLLHLIAAVADTNLYHRGGVEGAEFAARSARELLEGDPTAEQIEALDDAFIARNLSPGGCADLLAVTYFLDSMTP